MIKLSICILFFIIGIQTSQAQWEKEDSLRLKRMLEGKEEIKINEEAVKSIQFYFHPLMNSVGSLVMNFIHGFSSDMMGFWRWSSSSGRK